MKDKIKQEACFTSFVFFCEQELLQEKREELVLSKEKELVWWEVREGEARNRKRLNQTKA